MIPELGHFSLIIALFLAVSLGVLPILGAARNNPVLMSLARPLAFGQFVFIVLAFATLANAFLHNDFSVLYVAEHSNSQLPMHYRFAAIWGGHEGSLLLWVTILSIWTAAVATFSNEPSFPPHIAAKRYCMGNPELECSATYSTEKSLWRKALARVANASTINTNCPNAKGLAMLINAGLFRAAPSIGNTPKASTKNSATINEK